MLLELRVKELGVIADLGLVLGPGMIALTGETGAGKTLVVEAIELLLGGRADPVLVRPGAEEAVIEGRFAVATGEGGRGGGIDVNAGSEEVVLARTVPVSGRSRAYVNGRMATLATLEGTATGLVELHGQHSHQSLLSTAAQRRGLDAFGDIDLQPLAEARRKLKQAEVDLGGMGGDAASRAREQDMLAFQVAEIDAARLVSPDEEDELAVEEERLADARSHREAAEQASHAFAGDGGLSDAVGSVVAALARHSPLAELHQRLRAAAAELADIGTELRRAADGLEDDPERLAWVRERRQLLRQLRRKYGETLAEVLAYRKRARARLAELESFEQRAADLEAVRDEAVLEVMAAETVVGERRRLAAPRLGEAIEEQLRLLAMPKARVEVQIGEGRAGEDVVWLLGANPGEPALPLAKVASGGELARTMLAARLVLLAAGDEQVSPPTLVFDEVDAGIGGEAALAVGRALAGLGRHYQVVVVTHLPQVAAFADQHIAVHKHEAGGRTIASIRQLGDGERVVELSRMLSGQPDSDTARRHAEELLALGRSDNRGARRRNDRQPGRRSPVEPGVS
jgi:DNA repair protein RecN (Recombination protein N)